MMGFGELLLTTSLLACLGYALASLMTKSMRVNQVFKRSGAALENPADDRL